MTKGQPKKVLFVCLGNICRSPAAHGVLEHAITTQNLSSQITVDSAGIQSYHVGELPDERMRRAGKARGYTFDHHARQVTKEDFAEFDLILAMETNVLNFLKRICPNKNDLPKVRLYSEFVPNADGPDIPDPYQGEMSDFNHVLDLVEAATPKIISFLS